MSKKLKYRSTREDDTLNIEVALSKAVVLLDAVAKKALINGDDNLMLEVTDRWIAIGSLFAGGSESDDEEHADTSDSVTSYGFGVEKPEGVKDDD